MGHLLILLIMISFDMKIACFVTVLVILILFILDSMVGRHLNVGTYFVYWQA